jgi:dihydropteroate synthase
MGIVNVTPDSFSDGGEHLDPARAIEHGLRLIEEGAELLDVGGESTRPGAEPVPAELELERVLPVISALAQDGRAVLSIDTTKSEVARAALDAGAALVNDVSAGRDDPRLLALVAERGAGLILMHMQGTPRTMQERPRYADVVREVAQALRASATAAWRAGIETARIALDPGLGFGKLLEHNLDLMRALPELRSLGFSLGLGASRKSFLGRLSDEPNPARRGSETLAAVALGAYLGAEIHRVHEVAPARAALRVAEALSSSARA